MENAIEEYRRKHERNLKEIEKLRKEYERYISKRKKEILKRLKDLERRKIPKGIDEKLAKRVEADRVKYVSSLGRTIEGIETIGDLGKRLPELAKLHVDHGRYLLLVFEKDLYAINRLLKKLNEKYGEYVERLSRLQLPELNVETLLDEIERTEKLLEEHRAELERLKSRLEDKKVELSSKVQEEGIPELEGKLKELDSRRRNVEIEVRSKVSKVQKPLKRMRLGGLADEVARNSGLALERPGEFLGLLRDIYSRLDGKAKKAADWLLRNLEGKVKEAEELEREITEILSLKEEKLIRIKPIEEEIRTLERRIAEEEEAVKRLDRKLEHLQRELEDAMRTMEEVLGVEIEG